MSYCVYKHTAPNGKVYIGITKRNPVKRWNRGYGYKNNPNFYNAIEKYGWDNFQHEILLDGLSQEEARTHEKRLISLHQSNKCEYGYNRSAGGEPFYQCNHTDETRQKMSLDRKGKNTGAKNPMFGKGLCGSLNGMYGKHHSAEWKAERSKLYSGSGHPRYGEKWSEDEKRKNMMAQPNRKTVLQIDSNGEVVNEYNSIREAAKSLCVDHSTVQRWCRGVIKPKNGYTWKLSTKGGA